MNNFETERHCQLFDDSRKGELLYHYTSINSAIAILSTHSLLFGSLSKLNDMNESWRPVLCRCIEGNMIDVCDREISSYVQISLTSDDNPEDVDSRRGFDIATMWGHYADGGNGVCIVLNKERLERAISEIPGCYYGYVHYDKEYDSAVLFESTNPGDEIRCRIQEIFFCKSDEWRHEQEYRIVKKGIDSVDYLDISDCIEAIIFARLGAGRDEPVYDTRGYWALDKIRGRIPLFGYIPRDLNGGRSLVSADDQIIVWSSEERIDLENGQWTVDLKGY